MKTGTTFLQRTFDENVGALEAAGVRWPGSRLCFDAVADRFGRPRGVGTWSELLDELTTYSGTVLVSNELLAIRRQRAARALVRDLGAPVHVLITARDLVRVVPSQWKTGAENGRTTPWPEFIEALTKSDQSHPAVAWFWRRQDLPRIVRIWREAAGRSAVTVITVPPEPAEDAVLLDRFVSAAGIQGASLTAPARPPSRTHTSTVPLTLSAEQHAWAVQRAEEIASRVASSGVRIVGSSDDLRWSP